MSTEPSSITELRIAAEQLPVAIWMGRVPSGEVVYINAAFREVLGLDAPPEGATRGAFVEPYGVHKPDGSLYPEAEMPFERCVAARATVVVEDLVIHRRDGRRVFLRVFAKPIFDEAGELAFVLEAFTDKTREVEAEAARIEGERRLARAQRLESVGQLVAGIAHDFNNLLTVTKLVVAQLRASEGDDRSSEGLADIETVTDSAIALVRNLLGFTGRTSQQFSTHDLAEVASSVAGLASRTFDRRIDVRVDAPDGPAWVNADRAQLEQVLMNLLINARDALEGRAGAVTVRVTTRFLRWHEIGDTPGGDHAVLEVEDNGSGIAPSIRDRVFEPYFTTKTLGPIKGTGLGLSTVHGIVRGHSGFVDIVDNVPRGTIVRIALPSAAAPAVPQAGEPAPVPEPAKVGERQPLPTVLVVDDERLVRAATRRTLEEQGCAVVEAAHGEQALEVLDRAGGAISACVIDLVMPGMPTQDVIQALRERRPELPILLVTGLAIDEELRRVLAPHVRILTKPFGSEALEKALRALGVRAR